MYRATLGTIPGVSNATAAPTLEPGQLKQLDIEALAKQARNFVCPYCGEVLVHLPPNGDEELGMKSHCDPTPTRGAALLRYMGLLKDDAASDAEALWSASDTTEQHAETTNTTA